MNVETKTENLNKQYLCLFYIITAGSLDETMGSDEQEIIEMIHVIINVDEKKVRNFLNYVLVYIVSLGHYFISNRR